MTHEEALQRLGLERGADADSVRKAYLQSIKRHSPERDPEAFKQVRAAYELLTSPVFTLTSAPAEVADRDDVDASAEPAARPAAPPRATAIDRDPLAFYRARVSESKSGVEAEALARAAVENVGSAESYSLLIDTLDDLGRAWAVPDAAREAIARGYEDAFVPVLAARSPEALNDHELDAWRSRVERSYDESWAEVALLYVQRGRPAAASELVELVARRTREDPLAPRVSAWWPSTLALALLEQGEHVYAASVLSAIEPVSAAEERPDAANAAREQLARELVRVAPRVPPELTRAIAASVRAHQPGRADTDVIAFSRRNKREAREVLKFFMREAPMLLECYGAALQRKTPHGYLLESDRGWGLSGVVIAGLFVLSRFWVIPCVDHKDQKPATAPTEADLAASAGRGNPDWLRFMCHDAPNDLCDAARKVHAAGDCPSLYSALRELDAVQHAYGDQLTLSSKRASIVTELRVRGARICKFELKQGARQ